MRQSRLIQLSRHIRYARQGISWRVPLHLGCNRIKFPWISNEVFRGNLAVSLFWSQHRPLTLFHNLQNDWDKKNSSTHKIFEDELHTSFFTDTNKTHYLNSLLKTHGKIVPQFQSLNVPVSMHPIQHLNEKFSYFLPIENINILFTKPFNDSCVEKQATSVKRKRRLKMNKHKFKKRRDRQRALRKRIGK
ncbi:unnamed protein product [Pneumocystis jirovecii]|uniref:Ribosomal protein mS38 C-terminal domain-containing protein n=1 Tax=Pneumocystis jirovecii TaxID=42068 RepID=L0PDV3_PNEJI|nr:unnamed protein product [Pneumocystis jirovecii]